MWVRYTLDLHGIEAGCAGADRPAHGDCAVHDVGEASAALVHERTALDQQHVLAGVEHDADAHALVLAQAGGLLAGEAQAAGDLAVDHLRGNGRYLGGIGLAAARQLCRHADRKVAGEAFGDPDLDLEAGQVDDAEHRRVGGHVRALLDQHLADLAIERRAQGECVDLALQFGHDRALAIGQQLLVARIQSGAAALQRVFALGVGQAQLGLAQVVLGARNVDLRHRPALVGALVAFQVPRRGLAVDIGLVQCPARGGARDLGVQRGAAGLCLDAGERGLFLRQPAAQFRAVDLRQRLALFHRVARDHVQADGATGDRVQGGAVGGDDAALRGNVADQVAAPDLGDPHARRIDRTPARAPAGEQPAHDQQQREAGPAPDQPRARQAGGALRGGNGTILAGGVADAHGAWDLVGFELSGRMKRANIQTTESQRFFDPCGGVRGAVRTSGRTPEPVHWPLRKRSLSMCGIVGAIADRDVVPVLIEGLKRLEYRGYDSAGIAVFDGTKVRRVRRVGRVAEMEHAAAAEGVAGELGIAHTRWATHGVRERVQCPPACVRRAGRWCTTASSRTTTRSATELQAEGYEFSSQTDTEVIAHLVHRYQRRACRPASRRCRRR
jgi:hypothetical protein